MRFANKEKVQELVSTKSAMLVDMRSPVQFRDMPIQGAVNLPLRNLSNALIALTAKDKKRKTPIVLFGVGNNDLEVKSGIVYVEDLGFECYVTAYDLLKV